MQGLFLFYLCILLGAIFDSARDLYKNADYDVPPATAFDDDAKGVELRVSRAICL